MKHSINPLHLKSDKILMAPHPLRIILIGLFSLSFTACKNTGGQVEGSVQGGITTPAPSEKEWLLDLASNFDFDPDYVDISSSRAALKTATTSTINEDQFNQGAHYGTVFADDVLKINSTSDTALNSTWTPQFGSIVGYWKMDGNWEDSTTNNLDLTPFTNPGFAAGKIGTFSGNFSSSITQSASVADSPLLDDSDKMSFSFWVYPITLDGTPVGLISKRVIANDNQSYSFFFYTSNKLYIDIMGSGNRFASNTVFNTARWYHVSVVFDGTLAANQRVKLYINGEIDVTSTESSSAISDMNSSLSIGRLQGGNSVTGRIDDVAIWKGAALTSTEVSTIYNRQKQRFAAHYDSPIFDMGSSASWPNLKVNTPLPFLKEQPRVGSDESEDYVQSTATLNDDLVALWHLNESSGSTFSDSSGYASVSNATCSSCPSLVHRGLMGYAPRFGGAEYLSVANDSKFDFHTTGVTLSGWFKTGDVYCRLFWRPDTSSVNPNWGNAVRLGVNSTGVIDFLLAQSDRSLSNVATASTYTDSTWHHAVGTFNADTNTSTLYVDGKLVGTNSLPSGLLPVSTNITLGSDMPTYANYCKGQIDELAIWARPLNSSEVLQVYRRGANRIRYQVRSCADSACNCKSFGADGTSTDCDGDGVLNTVDGSDSHTSSWTGSTGTESSFAELHNNDNLDGTAFPIGNVLTSGLNLDFSRFPAAALPADNRYFQYRVLMESDDTNNLCSSAPCMPEISSVEAGPQGRYYGGTPSVVNKTSMSYQKLLTLSHTSSGSCVKYQISTDNGVNWKWWDGVDWSNASSDISTANTITDLSTPRLATLSSGEFKFKAFLTTNASHTQACELNSVDITYDASSP